MLGYLSHKRRYNALSQAKTALTNCYPAQPSALTICNPRQPSALTNRYPRQPSALTIVEKYVLFLGQE